MVKTTDRVGRLLLMFIASSSLAVPNVLKFVFDEVCESEEMLRTW